jgi:hypothetical protein
MSAPVLGACDRCGQWAALVGDDLCPPCAVGAEEARGARAVPEWWHAEQEAYEEWCAERGLRG